MKLTVQDKKGTRLSLVLLKIFEFYFCSDAIMHHPLENFFLHSSKLDTIQEMIECYGIILEACYDTIQLADQTVKIGFSAKQRTILLILAFHFFGLHVHIQYVNQTSPHKTKHLFRLYKIL